MSRCLLLITGLLVVHVASAQPGKPLVSITKVDSGWAGNSVNAVVFRKNSLVTHGDTQYIAFYDAEGRVVLGKRRTGAGRWQLKRTPYRGNIADAHNSISIMTDGAGYLHMAWDHHNTTLRYCRSIQPGALELSPEMPMTGDAEQRVSYPEFFKIPDGGLLFLYRDGSSGNGNLVINRYDLSTRQWTRLQSNLLDGEGRRNAYWQAFVDVKGVIHLSWVWRETPDVASNHDLCYARSGDGGKTWMTTSGRIYDLPVTAATAEYAIRIPVNSDLINQTSMCADASGRPYIATYWRDAGDSSPRYHLVYYDDERWLAQALDISHTAFSLSGAGTKQIPVSRPQLLIWDSGGLSKGMIIFRDKARGNKVSAALSADMRTGNWIARDLLSEGVGAWEPSYDTELWKMKGILSLFVQKVAQADAEGQTYLPSQMVKVIEWKVQDR